MVESSRQVNSARQPHSRNASCAMPAGPAHLSLSGSQLSAVFEAPGNIHARMLHALTFNGVLPVTRVAQSHLPHKHVVLSRAPPARLPCPSTSSSQRSSIVSQCIFTLLAPQCKPSNFQLQHSAFPTASSSIPALPDQPTIQQLRPHWPSLLVLDRYSLATVHPLLSNVSPTSAPHSTQAHATLIKEGLSNS